MVHLHSDKMGIKVCVCVMVTSNSSKAKRMTEHDSSTLRVRNPDCEKCANKISTFEQEHMRDPKCQMFTQLSVINYSVEVCMTYKKCLPLHTTFEKKVYEH